MTEMGSARYIVGDVFDVLASLEPASVDLIMTSPPFLALRSYLPADHPDKAREIGSEATPGEFIDTMLDVVEACARVLAPHGSLVFELGDTYAGSGGAGGDYNDGGLREGQPAWTGASTAERRSLSDSDSDAATIAASGSERTSYESWKGVDARNRGNTSSGTVKRQRENRDAWPLDKSKVLIPQLFAIALAYGFNPLTGRETEPWRVRNTVIWAKPNPPVGRDGDKFRPGHSTLTVACKAKDRYWDGDAVRVPAQQPEPAGDRSDRRTRVAMAADGKGDPGHHGAHPAGAPLLDWWEIPTHPYPGSHYATWSPKLVIPVIKSMCPQRVCRVCGMPSRRITRAERIAPADDSTRDKQRPNGNTNGVDHPPEIGWEFERETLGWSDCGHGDYRVGVVLDPFGGSGVTGMVATGHGLEAILIDLDERNAELAIERIGPMFLTVEHHERSVA